MSKSLIRSVFVLGTMLSGAVHAGAATARDFVGSWALKIGDRNLFVLTLTESDGQIQGNLERPIKFSETRGMFSDIHGGVRRDKVVSARLTDGALHLTTQNANDVKDQDKWVMRIHGDAADLTCDDLPPTVVLAPYAMQRATSVAKVATDWQRGRAYVAGDSDFANTEMKAIYDEDQRVRTTEKIDWDVILRGDAERRKATRKLLATNSLHTGEDYEEASFVFQHSDNSDDYLLAHVLAMVAISKGDGNAIWISAATLDRYLQKVGQKQVLGTQYSGDDKGNWTQEPYNAELISDALRRQLGVEPRALQTERLKAYAAQK